MEQVFKQTTELLFIIEHTDKQNEEDKCFTGKRSPFAGIIKFLAQNVKENMFIRLLYTIFR